MVPVLGPEAEVEKKTSRPENEDEEDDYMTMVIPDTLRGPETSLQRRRREQREVRLGLGPDRRISELTAT